MPPLKRPGPGDAGRGFAVVAGEVRSLASRTAEAASDIQQTVAGLQDETRAAVEFMETGVQEVDQRLRAAEAAGSDNAVLQQAVQRMFDLMNHLSEHSHFYGVSIRQVEAAGAELATVMEELQTSAGSVRHASQSLQQLVGRFRVSADTPSCLPALQAGWPLRGSFLRAALRTMQGEVSPCQPLLARVPADLAKKIRLSQRIVRHVLCHDPCPESSGHGYRIFLSAGWNEWAGKPQ